MQKKYLILAVIIITALLVSLLPLLQKEAKRQEANKNYTGDLIKIEKIKAEQKAINIYTPSKEQFSAKITIDGTKTKGSINPLIYGNNAWIENSKLGIPSFPTGDKKTFYNNQIEKFYSYFEIIKEMKPSIIRIPGGLQANHDNWRNYIGVYEQRPETVESGIKQIVVGGLDEHVSAAQNINAEAMFTVNYALGEKSAAELVEYLKPDGVKYYEIGNELNCGLKKGNLLVKKTAEDYAKNLIRFSEAMKAVDPGIKIGALDDCNKLGQDWYKTVNDIAKGKFDFWIKHAYSPGSDGNVKGITINDAKFEISTEHYFESDGLYEFEILAEGRKQFNKIPGFDVFMDQNKIGSINIDAFGGVFKNEPSPKFYAIKTEIKKGPHNLRIISSSNVENNVFLAIHPVIRALSNGKEYAIDLRNNKKIAGLVTAGALAVGNKIGEEKALFYGKPVFITEWNTLYSFDECSSNGILKDKKIMCSRNSGLREALNTADYYHMFIEKRDIIGEASFWLLFTEIGNMQISSSDIKINPSFYIAKMYANNIIGDIIESSVESPAYAVGYDKGITLGVVSKSMNIPYISSVAVSDGNEINIAIINKDTAKDANVQINLKNINPVKDAIVYRLYAEGLNEERLSIEEIQIQAASNFNIIMPRHSVNILKLKTQ